MRKLSRRDFLRSLGIGAAGLSLFEGTSVAEAGISIPAHIPMREFRLKYAKETATICPFCGGGCGAIVHTQDDKIIFSEGDPDHPVNRGGMCCKGGSISTLTFVVDKDGNRVPNPRRMTKVLYRAPGAEDWEEKDWNWAISEIAKRVKKTRDENWEEKQKVKFKDKDGNETEVEVPVNRTQAIAHLGSASLDNEENYLLHKMHRALGVINIDHHARL